MRYNNINGDEYVKDTILSQIAKPVIKETIPDFIKARKDIRNALIIQNRKEIASQNEEINNNTKKIIPFKCKFKADKPREVIIKNTDSEIISEKNFIYPTENYYSKNTLPNFELIEFQKKLLNGYRVSIEQKEKDEEEVEKEEEEDDDDTYNTYLEYLGLRNKKYLQSKYYTSNNELPGIEKLLYPITEKCLKKIKYRFSDYPSNINTEFIKWSFIRIFQKYYEVDIIEFKNKYKKDVNLIIIPIIEEMSKLFHIHKSIIFNIINPFMNEINKNVKKKSLLKRGISYSKYEKYWCRICLKFLCPFHFKITDKCKSITDINDNNLKITTPKIENDNIIKPPDYRFIDNIEMDYIKYGLREKVEKIINSCDCNSKKNSIRLEMNNKNNIYDNYQIQWAYLYKQMIKIKNKEDFFILCIRVRSMYKILMENMGDNYTRNDIFNFYLSPCVFRKIFQNKYECSLLRYLIKLIVDDGNLSYINNFLTSTYFLGISYEPLPELNLSNFIVFNESNRLTKYNGKIYIQKLKLISNYNSIENKIISQCDNSFYEPCDHYPDKCTKNNCKCVIRGFCLEYCGCFRKNNLNEINNICPYMLLNINKNEVFIIKNKKDANGNNQWILKSQVLGERKKLLYGKSSDNNQEGVFAAEEIKKGDFIGIYYGEIIEKDEIIKYNNVKENLNIDSFSINENCELISMQTGNLLSFINNPNNNEENVEQLRIIKNGVIHIAFFATKNIKIYERLVYSSKKSDNSSTNDIVTNNEITNENDDNSNSLIKTSISEKDFDDKSNNNMMEIE